MKVLIIGNGGREHALAYQAAKSPLVDQIYVAPGNAGTAQEHQCQNIPLAVTEIQQLCQFALDNRIDLTIVGPEIPLMLGIVDTFKQAGLCCLGPTQAAAQLESSKTFCKNFLKRHHIPTAEYASFSNVTEALAYLETVPMPVVIKADGLAAGKGVVIAQQKSEAIMCIQTMLTEQPFGDASHTIIIERFLQGEEASFIALVDGTTVIPFATSQDHKARFDGDTGPNTGGMGAYSPAPVVTTTVHHRIMNEVIIPTIQGLAAEGLVYQGFLYAGIMVAADGTPYVLEFNCRFGDPETQPIMLRLQSDIIPLCQQAANGELKPTHLSWDKRVALGVVMVQEGYPGNYQRGQVITGLEQPFTNDVKIFHAGTQQQGNKVITQGGRVICVTALGDTVREAQQQAYQAVETIRWEGACYRQDIGHKAITSHH